jgi:hypothetical protein
MMVEDILGERELNGSADIEAQLKIRSQVLHAQKVATRLAVKAFFHAGKLRNEAEKELERPSRP